MMKKEFIEDYGEFMLFKQTITLEDISVLIPDDVAIDMENLTERLSKVRDEVEGELTKNWVDVFKKALRNHDFPAKKTIEEKTKEYVEGKRFIKENTFEEQNVEDLFKEGVDIEKFLNDYAQYLWKDSYESIQLAREVDECGKIQERQGKKIEELNLPTGPYRCLKYAKINTVEELTEKTEEDLLKIRNLGKMSFGKIKKELQKLGLSLQK